MFGSVPFGSDTLVMNNWLIPNYPFVVWSVSRYELKIDSWSAPSELLSTWLLCWVWIDTIVRSTLSWIIARPKAANPYLIWMAHLVRSPIMKKVNPDVTLFSSSSS